MTQRRTLNANTLLLFGRIATLITVPVSANAINVTNLLDSGAGSLRDAITQAESSAGADQINFQISGTVNFSSVLPTITSDISINSNGFGVTFDGASAGGRGFFVESGGSLSLSNFTVQNFFEGSSSGGAIRTQSGNLNIFGSSFIDNTGFTGGAFFSSGGSVLIQDSTFSGNRGLQGGAISASGTTIDIVNSQLTGNTAIAPTGAPGGAGIGGALSFSSGSNATIRNSNIDNNVGEVAGGGIRINNSTTTVDIENSTINQNEAQGVSEDGGGLTISGGAQVIITNSEVNENTSEGNGGAIQIQNSGSSVTVERTTISGNSAEAGGGIRSDEGNVTVIESTISGNEATDGEGGGINATRGDQLTVENSTVSGNEASGGGGGIVVSTGASATVESSTIAFNNSGAGGAGIRFSTDSGSTFTASNTIFSENRNSGVLNSIGGSVDSSGFNLFDDDGGSIVGSTLTDQLNGSPDLQALADNGGATFTHALGASSDAIDSGSSNQATDQRGFLRPAGSQSDIGAFEFGAVPEPSNTVLLMSLLSLIALFRRKRR
ncbi:MAG: right-handed parallel beta-helix repeat-containing protein [Verrucomicrobiota bacterium]